MGTLLRACTIFISTFFCVTQTGFIVDTIMLKKNSAHDRRLVLIGWNTVPADAAMFNTAKSLHEQQSAALLDQLKTIPQSKPVTLYLETNDTTNNWYDCTISGFPDFEWGITHHVLPNIPEHSAVKPVPYSSIPIDYTVMRTYCNHLIYALHALANDNNNITTKKIKNCIKDITNRTLLIRSNAFLKEITTTKQKIHTAQMPAELIQAMEKNETLWKSVIEPFNGVIHPKTKSPLDSLPIIVRYWIVKQIKLDLPNALKIAQKSAHCINNIIHDTIHLHHSADSADLLNQIEKSTDDVIVIADKSTIDQLNQQTTGENWSTPYNRSIYAHHGYWCGLGAPEIKAVFARLS